jgi:hypothetical protein
MNELPDDKRAHLMNPETNDVRERLQETARAVATYLPPGIGFILLAFDFGPRKGRMEYVSNGQRADVIEAMREFIAKTESGGFATHIPEGLPMGDEEFNRLLNGPLSHPILMMSLNRLAIALSVVVRCDWPGWRRSFAGTLPRARREGRAKCELRHQPTI